MIAIRSETRIFCHINPSITAQLSPTVAPSAGTKALIKIINKGIITKIKETIAKGINNIQLLLLFFNPRT
jgi:hypothetical protein